MTTTYAPAPTSGRKRRTKAQMLTIRTAMKDLLSAEHPMTNRQVYYRLVSLGLIEKTEKEYKQTVTRLLSEMRMEGEIPFEWIADATRWDHKTTRWDGLQDLFRGLDYRRSIWRGDDLRLEVWLEKEALASVVMEITDPLDVSLMVTRGYSSLSFLWESAKAIRRRQAPTVVLILGDYDPSGQDIVRDTSEKLIEWTKKNPMNPMSSSWVRDARAIAVTPEQIEEWELPTRPTKKADPRAKSWDGTASVELDAIPPAEFRGLIHDEIMHYIDEDRVAEANEAERLEIEKLQSFALPWFAETHLGRAR